MSTVPSQNSRSLHCVGISGGKSTPWAPTSYFTCSVSLQTSQALVMSWEGARMKPSRWFIYPSLMSPLTGCFLLFFQESALFVFVVTGTLQIWAAGPNVDNKVWIFIRRLSLLVLKTEGCRRGQVVQVTACRHCLSPCCSPTLRLNPPTC